MKLFVSFLMTGLLVASVGCGKSSDSTPGFSTGEGGSEGGGSETTDCVGKVIFAAPVSNGNFGGAAGADTICNSNKPAGHSSSTFKAYVADIGSRAACYTSGNDNCSSSASGRVGWPLAALTLYCSVTNTAIGFTDSNAIMHATGYIDRANAYKYFTGFNIYNGISTSDNCSDYASTSGSSVAGSTNGGFGGGATLACSSAGYVACIEQ